jgi:hypothetical protein
LLEGSGKQYATGGSEAQATKDRVQLFHKLYEYTPKERPQNRKKRSSAMKDEGETDSDSYSDQSNSSLMNDEQEKSDRKKMKHESAPLPTVSVQNIISSPAFNVSIVAAIPVQDDVNANEITAAVSVPVMTDEIREAFWRDNMTEKDWMTGEEIESDPFFDISLEELMILLENPTVLIP